MKGYSWVAVFGVFDVFHEGHRFFLKEAAKHAEKILVVLASDQYVEGFKGVDHLHNQQERKKAIEESGLADKVVFGDDTPGGFTIFDNHEIDAVCLGHDQTALGQALADHFKAKNLHVKIFHIESHARHLYSSSKIRAKRHHSP
jgi:cytidyltransferase-like protein